MRTFRDRASIEAAGYVPGWHGEPAQVGDYAVAYGTGYWREGRVTKVTPTFVFVTYAAPTSGRTWTTKGTRNGRRTDLYVLPAIVEGSAVCGARHPRIDRVCILAPGHDTSHRSLDGHPWGQSEGEYR